MLYNVVCSPVNVPHTLLDVLCVCFTASYLPSLLLLSVIGHPHPPGTPVVGLHALAIAHQKLIRKRCERKIMNSQQGLPIICSYLPSLLLLSVIGQPHPPGTPVVGLHALTVAHQKLER